MTETGELRLTRGAVEAVVVPAEGGVLKLLRVAGRSVLATTPWAHSVTPGDSPAPTEAEWVERWRGGWQLCFPSAGSVDPASPWPEGFHGVASQSPWRVVRVGDGDVTLVWEDEHSLVATRTWQLTETGARVETVVHNGSGMPRPLVIAEHLVLGGDLLAPLFDAGATLSIEPPAGSLLAPLDYEGHPVGPPAAWPGRDDDRWATIDRHTQARVAALVDVEPCVIRVEGDYVRATVTWRGLAHALLWEELAQSLERPWNGEVVALGIEPTSAPHGMGTSLAGGTIELAPQESLTWAVELAVEWASPSEED